MRRTLRNGAGAQLAAAAKGRPSGPLSVRKGVRLVSKSTLSFPSASSASCGTYSSFMRRAATARSVQWQHFNAPFMAPRASGWRLQSFSQHATQDESGFEGGQHGNEDSLRRDRSIVRAKLAESPPGEWALDDLSYKRAMWLLRQGKQSDRAWLIERITSEEAVLRLACTEQGSLLLDNALRVGSDIKRRDALSKLAAVMTPHAVHWACDEFGSRSVRRLFALATRDQRARIVADICPMFLMCATSPFGAKFLVEVLARAAPNEVERIAREITPAVAKTMHTHPHANRVLSRIMSMLKSGESKSSIVASVVAAKDQLVTDPYGWRVLSTALLSMEPGARTALADALLQKLEILAINESGFKVICSCVEFASPKAASDALAIAANAAPLWGPHPHASHVIRRLLQGPRKDIDALLMACEPHVHEWGDLPQGRYILRSLLQSLDDDTAFRIIKRTCSQVAQWVLTEDGIACIDLAMKHARGADKRSIIDAALPSVAHLAKDQTYVGLRIISNALRHGNSDQRMQIVDEITPQTILLVADPRLRRPSGHQIVEQCLEHGTADQREAILDWLSILADPQVVADLLQVSQEDEDHLADLEEEVADYGDDDEEDNVEERTYYNAHDIDGSESDQQDADAVSTFSVSGNETVDAFSQRMLDEYGPE